MNILEKYDEINKTEFIYEESKTEYGFEDLDLVTIIEKVRDAEVGYEMLANIDDVDNFEIGFEEGYRYLETNLKALGVTYSPGYEGVKDTIKNMGERIGDVLLKL